MARLLTQLPLFVPDPKRIHLDQIVCPVVMVVMPHHHLIVVHDATDMIPDSLTVVGDSDPTPGSDDQANVFVVVHGTSSCIFVSIM